MSDNKSVYQIIAEQSWHKRHKRIWKHLETIPRFEYYRMKARLLGFIAGDGSASRRKERNRLKAIHNDINFYPDDKRVAELYCDTFEHLYTRRPRLTQNPTRTFYQARVSSKVAVLDLLSEGAINSLSWDIPEFCLDYHEYLVEWLRAFFDCEAYVNPKGIRVESVNFFGLLQIKHVLAALGIETRYFQYERKQENWNTNHILTINKRNSKIFAREIGFNSEKKSNKLKRILGVSFL